jgi:hypothetical protein
MKTTIGHRNKEALMKLRMFRRFVFSLALVGGIPFVVFAGEEEFEGLKVTTDNNGHIASISISNPATTLGIEAEFLISVSPTGTPTNGTVIFTDKIQRPMKDGELTLYFEKYGGQTAVWDYCSQHGKTVSFVIGTDRVPDEAYGKTSRLILNDGKRFIGRLAKLSGVAEGFSVAVEGACCGPIQFSNGTVKEIQQMR